MHKPIETLETALISENRGPQSTLGYRKRGAPESISQFLERAILCAQFGKIAVVEARHNYALEMDNARTKVAEGALAESIQIGFESPEEELKNALFHFAKRMLTELAHEGALEKMFVQNLDM